ncbi:MAG: BamA/TamA family outer membrane protein [Acidobacteriota bacterium]
MCKSSTQSLPQSFRFRSLHCLLLLVVLLGCSQSTELKAQSEKNQSTLTVTVGVKNGRLAVDRAKSRDGFVVSDEFRARLQSHLAETEVDRTINVFRDLIFDDLDERFSRLRRVYQYALSVDEEAKEPDDVLTTRVRTFPDEGSVGTWDAFTVEFAKWVEDGHDRSSLKEVFSDGGMLKHLNDISRHTALIFNASVRKPPRPFNAERGTIRFKVADPIGNLEDEQEYVITFPNEPDASKAASKRKNVLKLLKPFSGKLWRPDAMKGKVEDFFAERGLVGIVKISPAGKEPRRIEVPEGARIARVLFSKDVPGDSIEKIAYLLLPDKDFRAFAQTHPLKPVTGINGEVAYQALDYKDLNHTVGTEPYINQFQFQIQQLELSQLGFVAFQLEAPGEVRDQSSGSTFVEIFVNKAEEEETGTKPENPPEPANLVPNNEGVLAARPERPERRTGFVPPEPNFGEGTPSNDTAATTDADAASESEPSPPSASPTPMPRLAREGNETWTPKDKKNYVGFGISYKPGQNVRVFGLFQRERLGFLSPWDDLSIKGGAQENPLGALSYSADWVFFNTLKRRLSFQFSGTSDFVANRLFGGIKTDERRTGGFGRVELELFRDRSGSLMRLYGEGRRTTVDLLQNNVSVLKQNLTTLELGGLYLFESRAAYRPKQLRLEPRVRLGLGFGHDEPKFASLQLTGSYHQQLPFFLETDINGRFAFASNGTPIYELPALGGAEILRGFREDDAIGRVLWSLQNELWTPLPGTGGDQGIRRFLRRQVRLAGFVDLGGIYKAGTTPTGLRVGPGVGMRIIYRPAIIKVDWAYGLGNAAASGRGHGRFYFSIGTNLPF